MLGFFISHSHSIVSKLKEIGISSRSIITRRKVNKFDVPYTPHWWKLIPEREEKKWKTLKTLIEVVSWPSDSRER